MEGNSWWDVIVGSNGSDISAEGSVEIPVIEWYIPSSSQNGNTKKTDVSEHRNSDSEIEDKRVLETKDSNSVFNWSDVKGERKIENKIQQIVEDGMGDQSITVLEIPDIIISGINKTVESIDFIHELANSFTSSQAFNTNVKQSSKSVISTSQDSKWDSNVEMDNFNECFTKSLILAPENSSAYLPSDFTHKSIPLEHSEFYDKNKIEHEKLSGSIGNANEQDSDKGDHTQPKKTQKRKNEIKKYGPRRKTLILDPNQLKKKHYQRYKSNSKSKTVYLNSSKVLKSQIWQGKFFTTAIKTGKVQKYLKSKLSSLKEMSQAISEWECGLSEPLEREGACKLLRRAKAQFEHLNKIVNTYPKASKIPEANKVFDETRILAKSFLQLYERVEKNIIECDRLSKLEEEEENILNDNHSVDGKSGNEGSLEDTIYSNYVFITEQPESSLNQPVKTILKSGSELSKASEKKILFSTYSTNIYTNDIMSQALTKFDDQNILRDKETNITEYSVMKTHRKETESKRKIPRTKSPIPGETLERGVVEDLCAGQIAKKSIKKPLQNKQAKTSPQQLSVNKEPVKLGTATDKTNASNFKVLNRQFDLNINNKRNGWTLDQGLNKSIILNEKGSIREEISAEEMRNLQTEKIKLPVKDSKLPHQTSLSKAAEGISWGRLFNAPGASFAISQSETSQSVPCLELESKFKDMSCSPIKDLEFIDIPESDKDKSLKNGKTIFTSTLPHVDKSEQTPITTNSENFDSMNLTEALESCTLDVESRKVKSIAQQLENLQLLRLKSESEFTNENFCQLWTSPEEINNVLQW